MVIRHLLLQVRRARRRGYPSRWILWRDAERVITLPWSA